METNHKVIGVVLVVLALGLVAFLGSITGNVIVSDEQCKPLAQICGQDNIRFECNSNGHWERSDCPEDDVCKQVSSITAECHIAKE